MHFCPFPCIFSDYEGFVFLVPTVLIKHRGNNCTFFVCHFMMYFSQNTTILKKLIVSTKANHSCLPLDPVQYSPNRGNNSSLKCQGH